MRRVAEGTEVRVVRGFDSNRTAGPDQTVEFLHGPYDIGEMFNDVDRPQVVKSSIREGVGEGVEVDQNIGVAGGIEIHADDGGVRGTREFLDAAANVEKFQRFRVPSHGKKAK